MYHFVPHRWDIKISAWNIRHVGTKRPKLGLVVTRDETVCWNLWSQCTFSGVCTYLRERTGGRQTGRRVRGWASSSRQRQPPPGLCCRHDPIGVALESGEGLRKCLPEMPTIWPLGQPEGLREVSPLRARWTRACCRCMMRYIWSFML
jgi:hypothetical protein